MGEVDHFVDKMKHLGSFPIQGIECPGFDQAFDDLPVEGFGTCFIKYVKRRRETPFFLPRFYQISDGSFPDIFDGRKPEADVPL
jgi:hypothetical protein